MAAERSAQAAQATARAQLAAAIARIAQAKADVVEARANAESVLTSGIQDISNSLVDDFSLNDILRIILETMYRAIGFKDEGISRSSAFFYGRHRDELVMAVLRPEWRSAAA